MSTTTDEGKVAHAWIMRVAALIGVVATLVAAGFSVATYAARFATQEELAEVRARGSEPTRALAVTVDAHADRLDAIDGHYRALGERQQALEAKIDWLIQVELAQATRMRIQVPTPPRPRVVGPVPRDTDTAY